MVTAPPCPCLLFTWSSVGLCVTVDWMRSSFTDLSSHSCTLHWYLPLALICSPAFTRCSHSPLIVALKVALCVSSERCKSPSMLFWARNYGRSFIQRQKLSLGSPLSMRRLSRASTTLVGWLFLLRQHDYIFLLFISTSKKRANHAYFCVSSCRIA